MLLAGDIGATKTTLAIITTERGPSSPLTQRTYVSREHDDLATMAQAFLEEAGVEVAEAVFGVAGPVVEGRAEVTNLPWVVEKTSLQQALGLPRVHILNDLEAIANGVPFLSSHDLVTLNPGRSVAGGAMAVIAPGTGLGEAYLTWDGHRYRAYPCEGGHTDFGPTNSREIDLLRYLLQKHSHVSYERVCSGIGMPNIYAFLRDGGYAIEPAWLKDALAQATDLTPIIVAAALSKERSCELCRETLTMFVSILGSEAGNLALKTMATAGVYLAGGIPPRILDQLRAGGFMTAFTGKGRFADLLACIPIHVITNPGSALIGAAHCCMQAR